MKELKTGWGQRLDRKHVLEEYPRPLMQRDSYANLNGEWDYCITGHEQELSKLPWEGKILVPFSPEASLSGVGRQLQPGEYLWYRRTFQMPEDYVQGMRLLLHFGAVDQRCKVYVNQKLVTAHIGGYLPFEADITEALQPGISEVLQEIIVCVRDDSETSYYSRGKQTLKRGGMFYTAQSGIWQTVWMECVPADYLSEVLCKPNADCGEVTFKVKIRMMDGVEKIVRTDTDSLRVEIYAACIDAQCKAAPEEFWAVNGAVRKREEALGAAPEKGLFNRTAQSSSEIIYAGSLSNKIKIKPVHKKLWTPDAPYLYYYKLTYVEDEVTGYFAFRTFTVEPDEKGVMRMCLNHQPYFQKGVLDQGYWPDGLYTAPCDNALIYDIVKMKELGFNMLRKHIKIEPQRWYYHCDRLGMIVWQDMINGGGTYRFWFVTYLATFFNMFNYRIRDNCYGLLARRSERGKKLFELEMEQTVKALSVHPSIGTWVIFNEGWGQFDAVRMTKRLRELDNSRVIDSASGWFDQSCGDLRSQHYYFFKLILVWEKARATVLSELGGFPYQIESHSCGEKVYGYHPCRSLKELNQAYEKLMRDKIEPEIEKGLSATVYTQLSDVEDEVNGILTYDREVCKFEEMR